jgi:hypothetical protein
MGALARLELGVWSGWLRSLSFQVLVTCFEGMGKGMDKGMADMAGYMA